MPAEPVLALIVVAVLANLAVMAFVLVPSAFGRPGPLGFSRPDAADQQKAELAAVLGSPPHAEWEGDVPTWAYDRVVRIVSWVFILATSTIVAVTGLWPETQSAIFVLLALAGIFVLVVHDLLPSTALGPAKFVVEGSVAITFATLLIVLTGREASPFFFVFPLIVGGAALVVSPPVTLALAAVATLGYLIALTAGSTGLLNSTTIATVAINLTALILLAYVAMVIAREQRRARDAAIRLSTVDPLTGLFNRTYFFAAVEREIARSARSGRGFCLLMMDLDELKAVNDRHGHFIGDRVLRGVGEVIAEGVRRIDIAARYGGDEFVVLLPETEVTGAYVLAEKIRIGIADLTVPGTEVRSSMSVGVVSFPDDGRTSDELMISADQAMYASKHAGKNRVMGIPVGVGGRPGESV
ncbi:MAG: GGDEF domain-containing protein [Chloroflexota bacterium]|nr:GGDEF domain-containing protein [Chloroflexota bacterium]